MIKSYEPLNWRLTCQQLTRRCAQIRRTIRSFRRHPLCLPPPPSARYRRTHATRHTATHTAKNTRAPSRFSLAAAAVIARRPRDHQGHVTDGGLLRRTLKGGSRIKSRIYSRMFLYREFLRAKMRQSMLL